VRLGAPSSRPLLVLVVALSAGALWGCARAATGAPGALNVAPAEEGHASLVIRPADILDEQKPPRGRLPADIQPTHYDLQLRIVPEEDRFAGHANIRVKATKPRRVVWIHGRDMDVIAVRVHRHGKEPLEAAWEPVPKSDGLVALRLSDTLDPGEAVLEIRYTAPFDEQLKGLYRVRTAGDAYAFTQFQATDARGAFPCFDEPSAKVPFDVELEVRTDHVALGNTPQLSREAADKGFDRVRFATTRPLPTYLLAWAVGPLEVVEAPPIPANDVRGKAIPFRGVAVRGKGDELARALIETPAMVAELEGYLGIPYPYRKLDVVAVPDFAAGAMENVGLITFRDTLLLMGDDPPEWQKRAFAHVMAHELAHQWFGNLVTMPWWDDLWLNEAFATWLGHRTVEALYPEYHAALSLRDDVLGAMRSDSLRTARRIREPIRTDHDIRSAFDAITYDKGAGVLAMFERWVGESPFRGGLARYLRKHAHGTATTANLLEALSAAAGRDVASPFRSFLDQVGVPAVSVEPTCVQGGVQLSLRQGRYLPAGSDGDRDVQWEIPMCVRMGIGDDREDTHCFLLTEAAQEVLLETDGCATWVHPNADGAGYYRFTLPEDGWAALNDRGFGTLTAEEKLVFADSLRAAFGSGDLSLAAAFDALPTLARSDVRPVAEVPMGLVEMARDHLMTTTAQQAAVRRYGRALYADAWRQLGLDPAEGESGEDRLLRASVLRFMSLVVEDPNVRLHAARRGRAYMGFHRDRTLQPDAVAPDLVSTVLKVAVQQSRTEFFEFVLRTTFEVADPLLRARLLSAVSHTRDPSLAERVRALALDERLRVNEVTVPLRVQLSMPETREATWAWLEENYDALVKRVATKRRGDLPWLAAGFCSDADAERVEAFFGARVEDLRGGPRALAGTLEVIRLCAARAEAHRSDAIRYFRR
jgi:cytosol alanyl aminopeptidase